MILYELDINWLYCLAPILLYAEIHYRIWNIFSRYFKREPEIIADMPQRIGPGAKLPVFVCVKDANRYPIEIKEITVRVAGKQDRTVLAQKHYNSLRLSDPLWYDILYCDVARFKTDINIDVVIVYSSRKKDRTCVNDNYKLTSHKPFHVTLDPFSRPRLEGWVLGDMHTHSYLTNDQVEFGAPFEVNVLMSKAMELDFFASADHSYDLDDCVDNYLINDPTLPKWRLMWDTIERLNRTNKDFVVFPGEELSAGNSKNQNVHFLIFNNRSFFEGWGDSAEKWWRTAPQHKIPDVLTKLEKRALSFAAHPLVKPPFLQKWLIRRGIWTEKDLTIPGLDGIQFWNGDKEHFFKYGMPKWIDLLLCGHKITLIAGTDAHGNFNRFRQIGLPHISMREGHFEIFGTSLTGVLVDGALSLESLLDGLRKGHVIVTDGPVAAMTVERSAVSDQLSANTKIHIGETVRMRKGAINIEACSTPSYGELKRLSLIFGDISQKKETQRQIDIPLGSFEFSKNVVFENCPQPGYIRLELETQINKRIFSCFTNPIYVC